eukprot:COSAG02_NODE_1934_length_10318_cov_74.374009_1_plen_66_part_10
MSSIPHRRESRELKYLAHSCAHTRKRVGREGANDQEKDRETERGGGGGGGGKGGGGGGRGEEGEAE